MSLLQNTKQEKKKKRENGRERDPNILASVVCALAFI